MSDSSCRLRKILFCLLLAVMFFSCAQTSPSVNYSNASVVFDYVNENDTPSSRMSVFIDLASDAHRSEYVRIESLSTGYAWEVYSPLKLESGEKKYTGYTNFVMPSGELFPQGQYRVIYTDANNESVESVMNVVYTKDFADLKASEAIGLIKTLGGTQYWALYDQSDILLYLIEKQGDSSDFENLWNKGSNVFSIREIWMSQASRTICIMPKKYKSDTQKQDGGN